ncbi:MAG: hypothetical protein ACYC25_07825 [Paludibacter sp.]
MKQLVFLVIVFLISCSDPDKNPGYNKASAFVKEYSQLYFNSELYNYAYSPRMGYDYLKNDTSLFRVIYRHEDQESNLLVCGLKEFNKIFPILNDSLISIETGVLSINDNKYHLKGTDYSHSEIPVDTQHIIVDIDTETEFHIPAILVKKNPIRYFKNLEQIKEKYEILSIRKLKIGGGLIEMYFTRNDYLLYFPDNFPLKTNEAKEIIDYWIKKKNKGKSLDKNWYFYHDDKELDLG